MQALRLARHSAPLRRSLAVRSLATTANPTHVTSSSTSVSSSTAKSPSAIPLSNIEAQWEALSKEEQVTVHQQLEALQKKDWKELSLDEKKAGMFIALRWMRWVYTYCSHHSHHFLFIAIFFCRLSHFISVLRGVWSLWSPSSRYTTRSKSQSILSDYGSCRCCRSLVPRCYRYMSVILVWYIMPSAPLLTVLFYYIAPPPPRTLTKEWEEASNQRAKEQKMNPITGTFDFVIIPCYFRLPNLRYPNRINSHAKTIIFRYLIRRILGARLCPTQVEALHLHPH